MAPPLWGRRCPLGTRTPLNPYVRQALARKKAINRGGCQRGGATAPPLWNEIIDLYPPPMLESYSLLQGGSMGGGERAPVALCREPTEPAGETRGWAPQSCGKPAHKNPERPSAEGFYCPARARAALKIPAHEVQRDFPGLRCQPPGYGLSSSAW